MSSDPSLHVALLSYRAARHVGGQGVYVRNLSRALVEGGHRVTVLAGQPYPELDERVHLLRLPSLDLYGGKRKTFLPHPRELHAPLDAFELAYGLSGKFPEPLAFSLRAARALRNRGDIDVVHDNQCLGWGLLAIRRRLPVVARFHHPIAVDRRLHLASTSGTLKRLQVSRWYGFVGMQHRVARRLDQLITGSDSARTDIVRICGVAPERISVVPYGVDTDSFRPLPLVVRKTNRIVTTASADVPLKGLSVLLEAVAKLRTERQVELVVVGSPRPDGPTEADIDRLGLRDAVRFTAGLSERKLVELYASATLAAVPSLYEGFSLPAVEAMSCGVPLVATTGGALPEVVGRDGEEALLVEPADTGALASAIRRLLEDPELRGRLGEAGRRRVCERFTWRRTAEATVERYREAIGRRNKRP